MPNPPTKISKNTLNVFQSYSSGNYTTPDDDINFFRIQNLLVSNCNMTLEVTTSANLYTGKLINISYLNDNSSVNYVVNVTGGTSTFSFHKGDCVNLMYCDQNYIIASSSDLTNIVDWLVKHPDELLNKKSSINGIATFPKQL